MPDPYGTFQNIYCKLFKLFGKFWYEVLFIPYLKANAKTAVPANPNANFKII